MEKIKISFEPTDIWNNEDFRQLIKAITEKLAKKLGSEHEAQHAMMECLGQVMWEAQREGKPLDPESYLESLKKLV